MKSGRDIVGNNVYTGGKINQLITHGTEQDLSIWTKSVQVPGDGFLMGLLSSYKRIPPYTLVCAYFKTMSLTSVDMVNEDGKSREIRKQREE